MHPAASIKLYKYEPAHRLIRLKLVPGWLQEMVITPVPPFGVMAIEPSQPLLQLGSLATTLGGGRLGGPGATNTVSGPKLPIPTLQVAQPALQIG